MAAVLGAAGLVISVVPSAGAARPEVQVPSRVRPALAVFSVRNACGRPTTVDRNFLVVAFEAAELVPGNRYALVASWPANARRFPFLFEFVARRNTYATRGVRLYPFVAGDPIPRVAFVAHLELDNLGPANGSVNLTPSNRVDATVPACR